MKALTLSALLGIVLVGCSSPPTMYSWGDYENQIYLMYAKPDKATAEQQVHKLEEDFQKARSKNKPVPPGFHAHMGYLLYQLGKMPQAKEQFEAEKAAFPESATFMNRLLAKVQ